MFDLQQQQSTIIINAMKKFLSRTDVLHEMLMETRKEFSDTQSRAMARLAQTAKQLSDTKDQLSSTEIDLTNNLESAMSELKMKANRLRSDLSKFSVNQTATSLLSFCPEKISLEFAGRLSFGIFWT